jgi:glycosyltransferase involved in cell wall biosynthesis
MLIAGPNIVTTPNDADRILCNPAIDHILVPSTWVRDHYCSIAPELAQKILVWPAGVAEAQPSSRRSEAIVYCKDDRQLCAEAKQVIKASGLTPRVITYGTYSQKNYLKALQTAAALVYLSPSESQGLALQEAWIRDVPTFVHFTGVAHNDAFTWHDDMINAPYLHEEFGAFYTTTDELKELLAHTQDYHPRTRCQQTLSDYATTKQLLELTTLSV